MNIECVKIGTATLHLGDCLEAMKAMPDNAYSLAICDPPYGIGFDGDSTLGNNSSAKWKNPQKSEKYQQKYWDKNTPTKEYFTELQRVSKRQIIWGGNYFADKLSPSGGCIVWTKGVADGMSLSDAELAWTNACNNIKVIELLWSGFRKCEMVERIHSTQKPVKLYKWLLDRYAKPGDTILDTHHGSGSLSIACLDMGYSITAYEIDAEYFKASVERIQRSQQQCKLFDTGATWQQAEKVKGELTGSLFA